MNNARLSSKVHYEASKEVQSLQVECSETNKPTLTSSEQLSSSDEANSQQNKCEIDWHFLASLS